MSRTPSPPARRRRAFSLVEIVVAVGVLALGLAAVIGLMAPVSRSVTTNMDAEAAARAAEAAITYLKAMRWNNALNTIKTDAQFATQIAQEGTGTYNPRGDSRVMYLSRQGTKVGPWGDSVWANQHGEKYYEAVVVRNERVSPASRDSSSSTIAFTVRVRWPCFLPGTAGAGFNQVGYNPAPGRGQLQYDHSQKDVLYVNGSLTR